MHGDDDDVTDGQGLETAAAATPWGGAGQCASIMHINPTCQAELLQQHAARCMAARLFRVQLLGD
jgi:hypothetical protein